MKSKVEIDFKRLLSKCQKLVLLNPNSNWRLEKVGCALLASFCFHCSSNFAFDDEPDDCQSNSRATNRFSSRELVRGHSGADAGTATQIAYRVGARTEPGRF